MTRHRGVVSLCQNLIDSLQRIHPLTWWITSALKGRGQMKWFHFSATVLSALAITNREEVTNDVIQSSVLSSSWTVAVLWIEECLHVQGRIMNQARSQPKQKANSVSICPRTRGYWRSKDSVFHNDSHIIIARGLSDDEIFPGIRMEDWRGPQ
jgi:hypothetical protein